MASHFDEGVRCRNNGDWEGAIRHFSAAAGWYQNTGDLIGSADSYDNIGLANDKLKNYQAAVNYYEKALDIYELQISGSTRLATTYHNIACAQVNLGNYEKAIQRYHEAILIKERRSPGSNSLALSFDCLGRAYDSHGNASAAVEQHQKAIAIKERRSPGSKSLANSFIDIGFAFSHQGNYAAAIQNYRQAITIYKIEIPGSAGLAAAHSSIGHTYRNRGDYDAAIEHYQEAIAIQETQSPGSTNLAHSYYNIGLAHKVQENYSEAVHWFDKALFIYPLYSEDYAEALHGKVSVLIQNGEVSIAQQLLDEAHDFTRFHSHTKANAFVLWAQADLLAIQGKWEQAQMKIDSVANVFRGDDPATKVHSARIASMYGFIYLQNGLFELGRKEFMKSRAIYEELNLQKTHDYGVLLDRLGELEISTIDQTMASESSSAVVNVPFAGGVAASPPQGRATAIGESDHDGAEIDDPTALSEKWKRKLISGEIHTSLHSVKTRAELDFLLFKCSNLQKYVNDFSFCGENSILQAEQASVVQHQAQRLIDEGLFPAVNSMIKKRNALVGRLGGLTTDAERLTIQAEIQEWENRIKNEAAVAKQLLKDDALGAEATLRSDRSPGDHKKVFISHTGQDHNARIFAGLLHEALDRKGIDNFYDERSIELGTLWEAEIEYNARNCELFVCIFSENYPYRYWCQRELEFAISSGRMILPVYIDGNLPSNDQAVRKLLDESLQSRADQTTRHLWMENLDRLRKIEGIKVDLSVKTRELKLLPTVLDHICGVFCEEAPRPKNRGCSVM